MVTDNRQIQIRRDTTANWSSNNPTLAAGEPGFDTTLEKLKVGDGSTAWNSHPFVGADSIVVGRGTFASRPGSGTNTGDLYYCTDIGNVYRWNGSSWDVVEGGDLTVFTPPPSASWTALNSASVTADLDSRIVSVTSITTDSWKGEYRTLSPASNYTATTYLDHMVSPYSYLMDGMIVRNSGSGSFTSFGPQYASGWFLLTANYTSPTAFSATVTLLSVMKIPNWLRIRDDNTNRYYEYSYNGVDWIRHSSVTRTTFITPDQIGWATNAISATTGVPQATRLRHFAIT